MPLLTPQENKFPAEGPKKFKNEDTGQIRTGLWREFKAELHAGGIFQAVMLCKSTQELHGGKCAFRYTGYSQDGKMLFDKPVSITAGGKMDPTYGNEQQRVILLDIGAEDAHRCSKIVTTTTELPTGHSVLGDIYEHLKERVTNLS